MPRVRVDSITGTVLSATWDAGLLTTADGSKVELKIVGHAAGNGGNKRPVEIGAVEWNAATSTPISAFYYLRARYYDPGTGRFLSLRGRPRSWPVWSWRRHVKTSPADQASKARELCARSYRTQA